MDTLNNKGSALIVTYFVMSVLVVLSAGFALTTFNELNDARRYRDLIAAFWLAESAINIVKANPAMLDETGTQTLSYPNGGVYLSKDDSHPGKRIITAKGVVGGSHRLIQIEFPAKLPEVFQHNLSVKGNIEIKGNKATLVFNGKTKTSGQLINLAKHSHIYMEDLQEKVEPDLVSLMYPDANNNGIMDEFADFVEFNRNLIAAYPREEVIYINGNDTYTILPNRSLKDKKIIYVEGSLPGKGDVIIPYTGPLDEQQNLTIISTGNVTFHQMGSAQKNARLNIIAWSGYEETAPLSGARKGITFTHGTALLDEIDETSLTYGSLIANAGLIIRDVWSTKIFHYADPREGRRLPPGFEGLMGGGSHGYESEPNSWREM